jgi:hypothetical protein
MSTYGQLQSIQSTINSEKIFSSMQCVTLLLLMCVTNVFGQDEFEAGSNSFFDRRAMKLNYLYNPENQTYHNILVAPGTKDLAELLAAESSSTSTTSTTPVPSSIPTTTASSTTNNGSSLAPSADSPLPDTKGNMSFHLP